MPRPDVKLLQVAADEILVDILILLLEGSSTQKSIAATLGLDSGTASRRMAELEDGGLVMRDRSHGPYRLVYPELTGALLGAAVDLAERYQLDLAERAAAQAERLRQARRALGGNETR